MKHTHVVILAAGAGTKMWPFGLTHPKAALPVGARPLIHHTLDTLERLGAQAVTIVAGHLEGELRQAWLDWEEGSRGAASTGMGGTSGAKSSKLQVHWVTDNAGKGTAHSFHVAYELTAIKPRRWLVLYGDTLLFEEDIKRLLEHRLAGVTEGGVSDGGVIDVPIGSETLPDGAHAAVLVDAVGQESAQNWICADVAGDEVRRIVAHPRGGTWRLAGAMTLTPHAARLAAFTGEHGHRVQVGVMVPQDVDLSTTLQRAMERGYRVGAVTAAKPTVDLDKPWHVHYANRVMVSHLTDQLTESHIPDSAYVDPAARIDGHVHLGENARIDGPVVIKGHLIVGDNSHIHNGAVFQGNAMVGRQTRVGNYCLVEGNAVIGDRCVIDHAAEFGGVLMDQVYLYHYMEISGVIGRSVDIGAGSLCGTLRFDDDVTVHRVKGRPEKPPFAGNASYIGDFTRLGVGVILMPGTKIGPYCLVGPGVVLGNDLPENTRIFVEQKHVTGPWGPERYGW